MLFKRPIKKKKNLTFSRTIADFKLKTTGEKTTRLEISNKIILQEKKIDLILESKGEQVQPSVSNSLQ